MLNENVLELNMAISRKKSGSKYAVQCWKLQTEMTENESERKFWELTVCIVG
jgi:hypothetical protein